MDNPSAYGNPGGMPGQPMPAPALKHSGLGIASFVLAILAGLTFLGGFVFAGLQMTQVVAATANQDAAARQAAIQDATKEHAPQMAVAGLLMFAAAAGEGLAFILGLVSLFMKGSKKIFGILGVVFSAVPGVLFLLLMLLGVVTRHAS